MQNTSPKTIRYNCVHKQKQVFTMNYKEIYTDYYDQYYNKIESLIKSYFIKQKKSERTFGYGLQIVKKYIAETVKHKYDFEKDDPLIECYNFFVNRHRLYNSTSSIDRILQNEIYDYFVENESCESRSNKSFNGLIKKIAINESVKEISRIIINDSTYLQLFYDWSDMLEFEIRDYAAIQIDTRPKYAKLLKLKWGIIEAPVNVHNTSGDNLWKGYDVNKNGALLFAELVEHYRPHDLSSVKFINILYYLKKHSEKGIFVFKVIQPEYGKVIASKYGITITKFAKSAKFDDEDKRQMNQIEQAFCKSSNLILQ